MNLPGTATLTFTHSPVPIQLTTKSRAELSLPELVHATTPPCHLNPLLFNGHLQTAATTFPAIDIPITYKRRIFAAEDHTYEGEFAVDFVVPYLTAEEEKAAGKDTTLPPRTTFFTDAEWSRLHPASSQQQQQQEAQDEHGSENEDAKPLLIVLHGLSGGSHELYLRHVLAPLVSAEGGWDALVVNSRGCAMSEITTPVLYNARATWDVRQVVKWARKRWGPRRRMFGIGFSLGANILTNYLGEEGDKCELEAAVVVSNPWNLDVSSVILQSTWIGLNVYSKTMGGNMKKLLERHEQQISKNPRIDVEAVRKVKFLHEFDRVVQGPTWGYPTEGAYYRDASSCDSLLAVRVPLLAINASDDPIAVNEAIPYEEFKQNPFTILCTTSLGGHLSWFEWGGGRWFVKPIEAFFQKFIREIDVEATKEALKGEQVKPRGSDGGPRFEPMRRKLYLHDKVV